MPSSNLQPNHLQLLVDRFYKQNGPCCAGCDWWRFHNSVIGECTKSAPVSAEERTGMLQPEKWNIQIGAGHILTRREHHCGDFIDTYDWEAD